MTYMVELLTGPLHRVPIGGKLGKTALYCQGVSLGSRCVDSVPVAPNVVPSGPPLDTFCLISQNFDDNIRRTRAEV